MTNRLWYMDLILLNSFSTIPWLDISLKGVQEMHPSLQHIRRWCGRTSFFIHTHLWCGNHSAYSLTSSYFLSHMWADGIHCQGEHVLMKYVSWKFIMDQLVLCWLLVYRLPQSSFFIWVWHLAPTLWSNLYWQSWWIITHKKFLDFVAFPTLDVVLKLIARGPSILRIQVIVCCNFYDILRRIAKPFTCG